MQRASQEVIAKMKKQKTWEQQLKDWIFTDEFLVEQQTHGATGNDPAEYVDIPIDREIFYEVVLDFLDKHANVIEEICAHRMAEKRGTRE